MKNVSYSILPVACPKRKFPFFDYYYYYFCFFLCSWIWIDNEGYSGATIFPFFHGSRFFKKQRKTINYFLGRDTSQKRISFTITLFLFNENFFYLFFITNNCKNVFIHPFCVFWSWILSQIYSGHIDIGCILWKNSISKDFYAFRKQNKKKHW